MLKNGEDAQERVWRRWSVAANALERTEVRWLWRGRIPLEAITLLDGDPGLGKSLITIELAARSGLLVAKSPDDPDHERVLASTKSSLGPPMPSLRYRIRPLPLGLEVLQTEGMAYLADVPVVEWLGECDLNATQLLAAPQVESVEQAAASPGCARRSSGCAQRASPVGPSSGHGRKPGSSGNALASIPARMSSGICRRHRTLPPRRRS